MRTTISLDDRLGRTARRRAQQEGLSLSALVARALTSLLTDASPALRTRPFRLITVGGDGPRAGVDLDRTSALLVAEDERAYGVASED
jgi:hypothetical protein